MIKLMERTESDVYVIQPQGRIDASCVSEFAGHIHGQIHLGFRKVLIDFSQTEYISSSSLRMLMELYKTLKEKEGQLALCSVNENLNDLFQIVMLDRALPIYKTDFEAFDKML